MDGIILIKIQGRTLDNLPDEYTEEQYNQEYSKQEKIIAMEELRRERTKRLADVDWIFSEDYAIADASYQQWLAYRKALRDLPAVTEDPANPVWPEKPAMPRGTTTNISKRQEGLLNENIAMRGKITNLERKTTDQELELIQLKRRLNKLESK